MIVLKPKAPTSMTPAIRWIVIRSLLCEESLAQGKSLLSREIAVLKNLERNGYNNAEFWLNLNLGFKLKSILWLQNSGRVHLNQKWGMFLLDQKQKKELDEIKKANNLKAMERIKNLSKSPETKDQPQPSNTKLNVLDWIDCEEKEF